MSVTRVISQHAIGRLWDCSKEEALTDGVYQGSVRPCSVAARAI